MAKVFRLTPKKSKNQRKLYITDKKTKMLHLDPWTAAVKFGLLISGSSTGSLTGKSNLSLKIQTG
jgi:hypothetical protein